MEIAISSDFSQTLFQEIIFVILSSIAQINWVEVTNQSTLSVNAIQKGTSISCV